MDLEYARHRLELWGDWARENPARGLGYPCQSAEHRIFFDKSSVRYEPDNLDAEEIDWIVRQMDIVVRDIVIYYYVRRHSTQKIAGELGISRKTIEKKLEGVAGFVAGRLVVAA